MKLILEIEFGNEAMHRYSQARTIIKDALGVSAHRAKPTVGDGGSFRDVNGNHVGNWRVVDETEQATFTVDFLWDSLKRDPEHSDRRQTGWGTKTKVGLVACLDRIFGSNGRIR